ncbi:hypothetical protein JOF47_001516 [Paeniglutamicibacter kerguelensis]|uniref:Uncharacterized protein n=1 Tax=Paeniglutamicibacter kerguelensis TaxID=254788 RepID=A0ABS4XC15_9MICC|nr:hypothetical protein [Paeniglutamicibacter kerguelensis]
MRVSRSGDSPAPHRQANDRPALDGAAADAWGPLATRSLG